MTVAEIKQKLIDAGMVLEHAGHSDMARGHISVRTPGDPALFFMKPHGYGFDEITAENIVTCDLDGAKVAGAAPRHSEVYIHSEIYRARPDVGCVLHSHPPYAVAFSATTCRMKAYSLPGAFFLDGVGVYTGTIDLIRSPELGRGVAAALGANRAVLLKNHGVAVAGASIEETVIAAIMLENACKIQLLVEATGQAAPEFSQEHLHALRQKMAQPEQFAINFEYLRRKVRRMAPPV
jgi:L-fuculose-phosphate aldolase